MGLFNKGKEDNKQIFEMVATTKQEIKQEIKQNINDIKNNDIAKLRQNIENNDINYTKEIKELRDEIETLKKLIYTRENNLIQIKNTEKDDSINVNGYINFNNICKEIDISNINQTVLKYYLHTKGLYNVTINHHRNSYTFNTDYNIEDSEFKDLIHIVNKNVVFNKEFITYCNKNKEEIIKAIKDYNIKQEQYEKSKRNLESRNVKNYQSEIGTICGIKDNFNGIKWGNIYKIFSEKYKNFENDYNKYKRENTKYNEKLDKEFYPSKITYIVSVMGEGNFLLKIACDLYVTCE